LKTAQTYKESFQNGFFSFNTNTHTYFDNAIQPILNIYPDEIFDMCKERILNKMGRGGQGREHYAASIAIIKPLKKIESKKVHLESFVKVLRQTYNRLPAFLDELKKAGF
jgi:ribosomal protein L16/L10AE